MIRRMRPSKGFAGATTNEHPSPRARLRNLAQGLHEDCPIEESALQALGALITAELRAERRSILDPAPASALEVAPMTPTHRVTLAILLLVTTACAAALRQPGPSGSEPPLSLLRVEGNRFVDEAGETVVLRGVSFSDPDWLEPRGQWNRGYFEAARSWNANVVRIPVHPGRWRARGEEAFLSLLDQGSSGRENWGCT
jgi:hypothetical protein